MRVFKNGGRNEPSAEAARGRLRKRARARVHIETPNVLLIA